MPHTLFCKALFKIYPRFLYYPIKTHATSLIASIDIHSLFTHFFLCTHTSTQTHTHARMHASTYLEVGLYIANFSTLLATIPSLIPASSGLWYVCHCHVSERCCSGVQLVDMTYVCASFLLQWRTMLDLLAESLSSGKSRKPLMPVQLQSTPAPCKKGPRSSRKFARSRVSTVSPTPLFAYHLAYYSWHSFLLVCTHCCLHDQHFPLVAAGLQSSLFS